MLLKEFWVIRRIHLLLGEFFTRLLWICSTLKKRLLKWPSSLCGKVWQDIIIQLSGLLQKVEPVGERRPRGRPRKWVRGASEDCTVSQLWFLFICFILFFTAPENSSRKDWRTAGEEHWGALSVVWTSSPSVSAAVSISEYLQLDFVPQFHRSGTLTKLGTSSFSQLKIERVKRWSGLYLPRVAATLWRHEDTLDKSRKTMRNVSTQSSKHLEFRFLSVFYPKKGFLTGQDLI